MRKMILCAKGRNDKMNRNFTHSHLMFDHNLYFFSYKTWMRRCPDEYYHAHDGMEFLYIHEGEGRIILNDRLFLLKPRTLAYIQPYQVHLTRFESPRLRSVLKINLSLLYPYIRMYPSIESFVAYLEKSRAGDQVVQLSPEQDEEFTALLGSIDHTLSIVPALERKEQFLIYGTQFLSYLKTRLFDVRRPPGEDCKVQNRQSHHMEKIKAWIEQHYKEHYSLEKLSADIHLSGSYLSNLFRSFSGVTITEYITRRRLDEACLLLAHTSISIDQAGKQSGFPTPAYFCRCFKKRYLLTPQQYRTAAAASKRYPESPGNAGTD